MRIFVRGCAALTLICTFVTQGLTAQGEPLHDSLFGAVNAYRAAHGLTTVQASPTLQAAAQFMAEDMANFGPPATPHVSHDGRTARQRMADAGYPVGDAWTSEIIAWGTESVDGALRLWDNSPPHHAELNDGRYRAAGYGVACWGAFPCVWVVTFGSIVDSTYTRVASVPEFHAAFFAQSPYPTASPGQTVEWVVAFTNTGSTGWSVSDGTDAKLGTSNPQDAASPLAVPAWLAPNRAARQTTPFVGPGQQAWFRVALLAPPQPGTYRLWLRPVIDGVQWLEDAGAFVDLAVR